MAYLIDKSLLWDNTFSFITDSGTAYIAQLVETSPGSGSWTLNFILAYGSPKYSEIFKTMKTLTDNLIETLDAKGIKSLVVFIDGQNRDEIDKKTKIFTRWIKSPWEYTIDESPEIRIQGVRSGFYPQTNFIHISKNLKLVIPENVKKYCTNCGTENKNYKFCPNCAYDLQQI